jgi:hypothetical protein
MKVHNLRELVDRFVTTDADNCDCDVVFAGKEDYRVEWAKIINGRLVLGGKEIGDRSKGISGIAARLGGVVAFLRKAVSRTRSERNSGCD